MFILITGGSGSGKSAYAEQRICELADDRRIYLATMASNDEESWRRIARHRAMRAGKGFETVECPHHLTRLHLGGSSEQVNTTGILLECLSNLAANEMFDPKGSGKEAQQEILQGVRNLREQCRNLVVVTNEIFSDGIQYDPYTTAYQELLAGLNRELAEMADEVVEVVCGIPLILKKETGD